MLNNAIVLAATEVNTHDKWNSLLNIIQGAVGATTMKTLGLIGILLVVAGILGWAWGKRKGGADHNKIIWTVAVGAILVAPQAIEVVLQMLDGVINAVLRIFSGG